MLRCRRSIASMALSDGMCARQLQGLIRGTRTDFFRCQLRRPARHLARLLPECLVSARGHYGAKTANVQAVGLLCFICVCRRHHRDWRVGFGNSGGL